MSQWQVLDLGGDPAPGDPGRTQALARRLLDQAQLVESNTSRLRSVTSGADVLGMAGDYAPKFQEVLAELPGELAKLGTAYRRCGDALSAFATRLGEAKSQAGNALRQGQDAHDAIQGALRQVQAALPPDAAVSERQVVSQPLLEAAIASLDENVKAQVRPIARRAQFAEQNRQRARRLAQDAARLRGEAEGRCADGVRDALDGSGIKNKSWWQKAWDAISAPFRSWDAFVDLCKTVAMIAGTVALFISGPIGLALVAVALVAGAAVFANTLAKYARGEASLGALALDALGLIPGARGVTSLAALGRSAAGLAGGGKAVLGGLRAAPGAIRNGISNLRRSAVENTKKLSSYRVGRWFGPSWASTLDQCLELDATGICYAAEDGTLLVYPHPGSITADSWVLPEEGPRRPLRRTSEGDYTITDPERGYTLHFASVAETEVSEGVVVLPLVAISNRNGHHIDLDYNSDGLLTQVRHSGGYRIAVDTHDDLITALRLRSGDDGSDVTLLRYRYNDARRLIEVINSSNLPLRIDYDPDGRIIRWIDRNDTWYVYAYDEAGRCVRTTGTESYFNGTIAYRHDDPDQSVTEVTDSFGYSTWFHLNEANQLVREVDPLGHATVSEWDRYDRLLARTDPLGRTTRCGYDEAGNLVALIRPDGARILVEHNDLGQPVTITGPDGFVWHQQYDQRGNVTALTDPTGATTTYAYNDRGHLIAVTDALGHTRHITTNPAGLPVAVTDPLGTTTRYERDTFGRICAVTDPIGGLTSLGWTTEGKLTWRALPDGTIERWTYDGEGNLIEHVDALGQPTRLDYTAFDLLSAQTGSDGAPHGTEHYTYDPAGNVTHATWPTPSGGPDVDTPTADISGDREYTGTLIRRAGNIRYRHDRQGRIVMRQQKRLSTKPRTWHYTWDADDRLVSVSTPDGEHWSYGYDPVGRRIVKRHLTADKSAVIEQVSFTWDGVTLAEQTHTTPSSPTVDPPHGPASPAASARSPRPNGPDLVKLPRNGLTSSSTPSSPTSSAPPPSSSTPMAPSPGEHRPPCGAPRQSPPSIAPTPRCVSPANTTTQKPA